MSRIQVLPVLLAVLSGLLLYGHGMVMMVAAENQGASESDNRTHCMLPDYKLVLLLNFRWLLKSSHA